MILSTAYAAPIQYFSYMLNKPCRIEKFENYQKQSYRNRCTILSASGPIDLTIPVQGGASSQCPIREVRIAPHNNWRKNHWHTLCTCYGGSPFFEFYAPDVEPLYLHLAPDQFLWDFNSRLTSLLIRLLHLPESILSTTDCWEPHATDNLTLLLQPKSNWQDSNYFHTPYYQPFSEKLGFIPGLSIFDLLFNMGPEAILILKQNFNPHLS